MNKRIWGFGKVTAPVFGLGLVGVVGCGQGFSASDCRETHTCSPTGGQGDETTSAGAPAVGNGDSAANGGEPGNVGGSRNVNVAGSENAAGSANVDMPVAGAGGETTVETGCHLAADCSDGDPSNGEESCGADGTCTPGNPPPTVVSVSPPDKATTADPDGTVVITFSEPLDAKTITATNIKLLDGTTEVKGKLTYKDNTVTFTPSVPLSMLESYKLSIAVGVTDAAGAPLLAAYSSTFTTRDGAWATPIDAVVGSLSRLSDALPISATGNALLAWDVDKADGCPASAGWFRFGAAVGAAKELDSTHSGCSEVTAGGNAAGTGAVAWTVPDSSAGLLAQQLRSGAWLATSTNLTHLFISSPRVGVSPSGMVTLLVNGTGGGTTAWRTDASGAWVAKADVLSAGKAHSPASIAFDADGNGLAVWAAETSSHITEILSSRYTVASGKWSPATAIPDTFGSNALEGAVDYAPSIAMTNDGDAMAVWMQSSGEGGTDMVTSIFSHVSGSWAADSYAFGPDAVDSAAEAAVTYDGQAFLVSWVGNTATGGSDACGNSDCVRTNRYDLKAGTWGTTAVQQTKAADVAALKSPRLVSDGHGNSLLVWAKPTGTNTYSLVSQRYTAGKWSAITAIPGGTVTDPHFGTSTLPLSMNASGMAVLAWGNYANTGLISTIRLASFF